MVSMLHAQIPNGGFENESTLKTPNIPQKWKTLGEVSVGYPSMNEKSIRVKNTATQEAILLSDTGSTTFVNAKYNKLNARPDSLKVWLNYSLDAGDTLIVEYLGKETSNIFGTGSSKYTGQRQAFLPQRIKIAYTSPGLADSAKIGFRIKTANLATSNSFFEINKLDLLNLAGNSVATFPNKNFNSWFMDSSVYPTQWLTFKSDAQLRDGIVYDGLSEITSDAHVGTNALKLNTLMIKGQVNFGGATTFPFEPITVFNFKHNDFFTKPTFSVDKPYNLLKGHYKYTSVNNDSLLIRVLMFKSGSIVGKNDFVRSANVSTYTEFSLPLTFLTDPDSCSILIRPCHPFIASPNMGTTLWVDDLKLEEATTTSVHAINESGLIIYPNPTSGKVTLQCAHEELKNISIFNAEGKRVLTKELDGNTDLLDLSNLNNGIYVIQTAYGNTSKSQIITIQK